MKCSNLSKVIGSGVLALSLATMPLTLPASAQNNNQSEGPVVDTTPFQETKNDFNNFGWLGLIGLVGLVNLLRKGKNSEHHNDNEVNPSGYRNPDAVHPSSYADPDAVGRSYTDPDVVNRPGDNRSNRP